jgi:hypothetical protein
LHLVFSVVIPEAGRSAAVRNPLSQYDEILARWLWIPGSPLRGAPE